MSARWSRSSGRSCRVVVAGGWVAAAQRGDAVSGGPPGGSGRAAEQLGDLRIWQPGHVMQCDSLPLLVGKLSPGVPERLVDVSLAIVAGTAPTGGLGWLGHRPGPAA